MLKPFQVSKGTKVLTHLRTACIFVQYLLAINQSLDLGRLIVCFIFIYRFDTLQHIFDLRQLPGSISSENACQRRLHSRHKFLIIMAGFMGAVLTHCRALYRASLAFASDVRRKNHEISCALDAQPATHASCIATHSKFRDRNAAVLRTSGARACASYIVSPGRNRPGAAALRISSVGTSSVDTGVRRCCSSRHFGTGPGGSDRSSGTRCIQGAASAVKGAATPSVRCLTVWACWLIVRAFHAGRRRTIAVPQATVPAALGGADRPIVTMFAWRLVVMPAAAASGWTAASAVRCFFSPSKFAALSGAWLSPSEPVVLGGASLG